LNPSDPPAGPGPDQAGVPEPPARAGTSTFTIEGRSAPALFVVGWIATLAGIAMVSIAILSGGTPASRILLVVGLIALGVGLIAAAGSQGIERRARGVLPYVGPSPFLVLAAVVPVTALAGLVVGIPFALLDVPLDGPFGALLGVSLQVLVYVGLLRLLVVDTGALDWPAMGVRRLDARAVLDILGGALWALPVVFATGVLGAVLFQLVPVRPDSPLPPTGTATGLALSLLAGMIVAPFGEEVLFRGFATTAWVRARGTVPGIVLGALVFAFAHIIAVSGVSALDAFQGAMVAFIGRLPIALALGWIFVRRGTIWASFGLHAAFNGILLVVAELAASGR
jgi:membrane protease YdiL (CAAX protease family)